MEGGGGIHIEAKDLGVSIRTNFEPNDNPHDCSRQFNP